MAVEVLMPKIGLTMTEGKIVEWKKKEGDWVEKGEVLFVFETEKVTIEVESQESGYLLKIIAQVGEVVPVGGVVALLGSSLDDKADRSKVLMSEIAKIKAEDEVGSTKVGIEEVRKVRATPLARRIARELGVNLNEVTPSDGVRVRRTDVEAFYKRNLTTRASAEGEKEKRGSRIEQISGMRRIIAEKMLKSKTHAAQAYHVISADATNLLKAREALLPVVERKVGVRTTITDILMKVTSAAILEHPVMNTQWSDEGIIWFEKVHMGMAMALENGLVVPVIRNICEKSISEIARERADLIEKGRKGKLTPDDIKGSTFTLSSLGMYGLEQFTAIINQPESAIIAVGAIIDKAVVENKEIVIKPMMKITLTYDHRIIDGAKAAEFMMTLKSFIEEPIKIIA